MNNSRRSEIKKIKKNLSKLLDELNYVLIDEEYYFNNIPENLEGSQNYDNSETDIDVLECSIKFLEDSINTLEEVV